MSRISALDDTIVAIATPMGRGGIGIVRLSGPDAVRIVERIFQPAGPKRLGETASHRLVYGWIVLPDQEARVDEVLVAVMRAPKTYTRQDVVEIHCHGGSAILRTVLEETCRLGARPADPGEFTKRAFLNGRIDLAQAEAVLDVISSSTRSFLKVSTAQLKGDLSRELGVIRDLLMKTYVYLEALVNFPEDDDEVDKDTRMFPFLEEARSRITKLVATARHGRLLKEGVRVVLCGRPNVGKSSLLNCLLKVPRAIVSGVAGTTRDTIEETAQIQGVPVYLTDTAGILTPRDELEAAALERTRLAVEAADLVLVVLDAAEGVTEADLEILCSVRGQKILVVWNKCDLSTAFVHGTARDALEGDSEQIEVSALRKTGLDRLEQAIVRSVTGEIEDWHVNTLMISNERHHQALQACQSLVGQAMEHLQGGLPLEFVSEDIKEAVRHLDRITGRDVDAELLETIFSQFCVGK